MKVRVHADNLNVIQQTAMFKLAHVVSPLHLKQCFSSFSECQPSQTY